MSEKSPVKSDLLKKEEEKVANPLTNLRANPIEDDLDDFF